MRNIVVGTERINVTMTHTQPWPSQIVWFVETDKKQVPISQNNLIANCDKCYKGCYGVEINFPNMARVSPLQEQFE